MMKNNKDRISDCYIFPVFSGCISIKTQELNKDWPCEKKIIEWWPKDFCTELYIYVIHIISLSCSTC